MTTHQWTDNDGDTLEVTTFSDGQPVFRAEGLVELDHSQVRGLIAVLQDSLRAAEVASRSTDAVAPDGPRHVHDCVLMNCASENAGTPEPTTSVLEDAHAAIYGDREDDYGSPRTNMTRTAILWQGLLLHKLADGASIDPEDVARCMVGVKLARDVHAPKRDNRVDGAGYLALLDRMETGQ